MPSRKQLTGFISIIQFILFLAHFFIYETWTFSSDVPPGFGIKLVLGILSISFVASSVFAFRYTNAVVRAIYKVSAIWLGLLSFLFLAAAASWIIFGITQLAGMSINFHRLVEVLFGLAVAIGVYGVLNASCTRITRATVRLANLPLRTCPR